jgi:hypothetical protein
LTAESAVVKSLDCVLMQGNRVGCCISTFHAFWFAFLKPDKIGSGFVEKLERFIGKD